MHRLEVDHTASRHSGRRCHSQIIHLEHHRECSWQLDTLTIRQTQHLIVIEHGVKVLNPESVDWSVKLNPFLHIRSISDIASDNGSNNTVSPFVGENIGVSKKFIHGD